MDYEGPGRRRPSSRLEPPPSPNLPIQLAASANVAAPQPTALARGNARNIAQLQQAVKLDEELAGKYLPSPLAIFPLRMCGPDDAFKPPSSLLHRIWDLVHSKTPVPRKPDITFSTKTDALAANTK